jgi:hypothetical protein
MPDAPSQQLDACTTPHELLTQVASIRGPLNAYVASHAVYLLGRLIGQRSDAAIDGNPALSALLSAIAAQAANSRERELSKASWGLGKLWPAVREQATQRLVQRALAALCTAAASSSAAANADARSLAGLVHACGTVCSGPSRALASLQRQLAARADIKPQDLANALWAVARLGAQLEPVLGSALGEALRAASGAWKAQELSMAAWALAKLQPASVGELMGSVLAALEAPSGRGSSLLGALSAQGAANVLWAASRVEPLPAARLVAALAAQAERRAADLTPQGVANVCGACARLGGEAAAPCGDSSRGRLK